MDSEERRELKDDLQLMPLRKDGLMMTSVSRTVSPGQEQQKQQQTNKAVHSVEVFTICS